MSILKNYRKRELSFLANEIVDEYDFENEVDLESIAKKFISFHYDNYGVEEDGTEFEGLIIYDGTDFHIHINLDLVGYKNSKRARFSFAHELGHYFIIEHHYLLKNNYNPSKFNPKETNVIELEANYFAGVFLMPEKKFKRLCYNIKFSLDLVTIISEYFNVSRLAVLLRYVEVGAYPIMIAYCKDGILEWFDRNEEFPYKVFKTKVGKELPINSTVGEYFKIGDYAKHTDVQRIDVEDRFYYNGKDEVILNEQCFYSEYDYVISLIWPD